MAFTKFIMSLMVNGVDSGARGLSRFWPVKFGQSILCLAIAKAFYSRSLSKKFFPFKSMNKHYIVFQMIQITYRERKNPEAGVLHTFSACRRPKPFQF